MMCDTPPKEHKHTLALWARSTLAACGATAFLCGITQKTAYAETAFTPITLSTQAQKAENLTYATATQGTVFRMLPAMSRVQPDATHTLTLHPAGSGKVLDILVLPGQAVQKGQVLLHYQNHALHIARLQETQTRTALAAALATQQEAAQAYARARTLAGQTVSVGEVQKRLATLQQAKENVAARQAELAVLKHRFEEEYTSATEQHAPHDETSTLIAPFAGTITQITTAIAADIDPPQPLLSLSDSQHVWVISDIAPQDAALLAPAGQQDITLPGTTAPPLRTTLETIGTAADPATGLVPVLSRVPNMQGSLRPGMVLNSLLQTTESQSGVIVPSQAVQTINDQNFVFQKLPNATLQPMLVNTGLDDGTNVVILSGLQTGAPVVLHGSLALKAMMLLPSMDAE